MRTSSHPPYLDVLLTFARNNLVREMTFRMNFIAHGVAVTFWMGLQLFFYNLIYQHRDEIGPGSGWTRERYFVFLATVMMVNSLMQTFFVPNMKLFSELIRKGNLDFALLKPIDTQFLITFARMDWSALGNFFFGIGVLIYALIKMDYVPSVLQCVLYAIYILLGVAIFYSVVLAMATSSIWMGRNQSLDQFWFYITTFARYPLEIYTGSLGTPIRYVFTFIIPVLVVVNVPARIMAMGLREDHWPLACYTVCISLISLFLSRKLFNFALRQYRSASS